MIRMIFYIKCYVTVAPPDGQRLTMWNPLCLKIVQYYYFVLTLGGRHLLDQSVDRVVILTIFLMKIYYH